MRSFYKVTNSSKMTFRCPSEPILILLHLIKNIFFHFSTKISKLTLPFQRATSSIWAFAKFPNPSDPQALQPPNTGKNTQPKELSWTLNSLNKHRLNQAECKSQYNIFLFFLKCHLCCVIRLRWISPGIMSIDHHSSKIASDCSAPQ